MTDEWITGGYSDPVDELNARRDRMNRDGYSPCNIAACNCGSWHRRPSQRELNLEEALQRLVNVQNGPPLIRDEDEWSEAMALSRKALE